MYIYTFAQVDWTYTTCRVPSAVCVAQSSHSYARIWPFCSGSSLLSYPDTNSGASLLHLTRSLRDQPVYCRSKFRITQTRPRSANLFKLLFAEESSWNHAFPTITLVCFYYGCNSKKWLFLLVLPNFLEPILLLMISQFVHSHFNNFILYIIRIPS